MTALDAIEAISRLGCFLGAMGHLFFFFRSWSKLDSSKAGADTIHEPKKPVPRSREKAEKGEKPMTALNIPTIGFQRLSVFLSWPSFSRLLFYFQALTVHRTAA